MINENSFPYDLLSRPQGATGERLKSRRMSARGLDHSGGPTDRPVAKKYLMNETVFIFLLCNFATGLKMNIRSLYTT